jgi:hypothetical protein
VQYQPIQDVELTILMPCLNEAETLAVCINKANAYLARSGVRGEVLIADNGSTDGSQEIARSLGARVVEVPRRGYGAALWAGIQDARGRYTIFGDSDDSYDFSNLDAFVERLRTGVDVVMGNRFQGGIKAGAMPFLHKYLGNPVLSFLGRLFFNIPVGDFHCGLRGFNTERIRELELNTTGMEFASEFVVRAAMEGYSIEEVPTILSPDGRSRPPHLRTWRDGWRHLRFLLLYSPKWLFFYPGLLLLVAGLTGSALLFAGPLQVTSSVQLGIHSFLVSGVGVLVGLQFITLAVFAKRYGTRHGFIPRSDRFGDVLDALTLERVLIAGGLLIAGGVFGVVHAVQQWAALDFGAITYPQMLRQLILSLVAVAGGFQLALLAFLSGLLDIPTGNRMKRTRKSDAAG